MLRVEFQDHENTTTIKIQGRLVEKFADEVHSLVTLTQPKSRLVVDLSDMTYASEAGEQCLRWLKWIGAQFVAESAYPCGICDRLHLPLARINSSFPPAKHRRGSSRAPGKIKHPA